MSRVKLPQLPWHGVKQLELKLPDNWHVEVCNMAGHDRPALTDDQIRSAILSPVGTPPIRELARGKREVVIVCDDITRITRVAKIVPSVLDELKAGGVADESIRFICATGAHGAMNRTDMARKLGEPVLARFPVYNHNPFDNLTYVGTTTYGTRVSINAEVMRCDLKIAIGSVTPHPLTVFSGGGKIILPGVASFETILANHSMVLDAHERADYSKNSVRLDMEEAARLAGLDFLIEVIFNGLGDSVALFAGAPEPAHALTVEEARRHYLTPRAEDKDIVIANAFAEVNEALKGVRVAFPSVSQEGGDVLLVRNAPDGQVVHYLFGGFGKHSPGRIAHTCAIPAHVNHVISLTKYPDIAGAGHFSNPEKVLFASGWTHALDRLKRFHRGSASVAVYPHADVQYFG